MIITCCARYLAVIGFNCVITGYLEDNLIK